MTDAADAAFAHAREMIAAAKRAGSDSLNFQQKETHALTRLPDEIGDLEGLRELNLTDIPIEDLSPLRDMVGLEYLGLAFVPATDFTPLQGLTTLRILDLSRTSIIDLSPLQGLVALETLTLTRTRVADLAPLRGLTALQDLELARTQVGDLAPLEGLTALKQLGLGDTQVQDLTPLRELTRLQRLDLAGAAVSDFSPLRDLSTLSYLNLNNTDVTELTALSWLSSLTSLSLSSTPVSDLSPLAGLTGLNKLVLDNTKVSGLAPLAGASGLTELYLSGTGDLDLTPLAGLAGLARLDLDDSAVRDLRPLQGLPQFAENPEGFGLTFDRCAATRIDERVREISAINDPAPRARELFDYLETWEPPWEQVPEADDLVTVEVVGDVIELAARHPSEVEQDDALKRALHERLRDKADELARLAGNIHPRLSEMARGLFKKLDCPFEDLDLVRVHLDVEDCADIFERRESRQGEYAFSPDVVDVLADIARDGPGLTFDNPDVEVLEDRKRRFTAKPPGEEVRAAHAEMSRQVSASEVFGERLRAVEDRLDGRDLPSSGVMQEAVHRNVLIKIGRLGLRSAEFGAVWVTLSPWVVEHWPLVLELSATYGPGFTRWLVAAVSNVQEMAGILANVELKPVPREGRKD